MAEPLISPLEAVVTSDPRDFCACLHSRLDHVTGDDGQPVCVLCRYVYLASVAFPYHTFHLTYPHNRPADLPTQLAYYQPPPGWDAPVSGVHRA